ncbi:diguanylate cyclase domain-containing protein [Phenylobacterium sp.]|uniref:diguanylate cyclase domain-containing protein n=1 Tax=Phenylobacterium sp. TaxID=1871053 RepID=UPI00286CADAC|nr:diguanylate cyclase [Phenylobacterium sp.]
MPVNGLIASHRPYKRARIAFTRHSRSVALKIVSVLALIALASFGGSYYAVTRLVSTDALYSDLLEHEAMAMRMVTRAGILAVDDSRLLLRLVTESDDYTRQRLLGERDQNQHRLIEALERAARLVPRVASVIRSFINQFDVLVENSREVEALVAAGQPAEATDFLRRQHEPLFLDLRGRMRDLVQRLEDEVIRAMSGATRSSHATYAWTLWAVGAGALASLGLASFLLRRVVTDPLKALKARMRALEGGNTRSPVPGVDRRDEIGRMAAAVESFRLAAIRQAVLDQQAHTDALTGVLNRRGVDARVTRLAARRVPIAAIAIDLDHFKETNDTYGHAAGDALLVEVASRLTEATRAGDVVGRLGGDEFMVILQDVTSQWELEQVANRISHVLHQPVPFGSRSLRLGATLGTGCTLGPDAVAADLLEAADAALMRAKKVQRGSIGFVPPTPGVVHNIAG